MDKLKKYLKPVGICLTVAAIIFLIKKIAEMDFNISDLANKNIAAAVIISVIICSLIIVCGCIPWLSYVRALTGKKISFSEASRVYVRSNIFKYIPGNVFQFVGRNQLAVDKDISHSDVAVATGLDIVSTIIVTFIFSIVLLGKRISELLSIIDIGKLAAAATILIAVMTVVLVVLFRKFSGKIIELLRHYLSVFSKKNIRYSMSAVIYYFFFTLLSAVSYAAVIWLTFGSKGISPDLSELVVLSGAYMISWLIGFVTPGSPGGIGIRESVMVLLSDPSYQDVVVLYVLIQRIASVIADLLTFVISELLGLIFKRVKKEESSNG